MKLLIQFPPLFPLLIKFPQCLLYPFIFYPLIISPFLLSNTVPMILIVPTEFLCMIAVSTFWFKYYELHTTKWLFLCLNIYVWSKPLCLNTYIIIKRFFYGDLSYIIWGCKSTLRQMQVSPLCFYGQITLLFPNKKFSESFQKLKFIFLYFDLRCISKVMTF